MKRLHFLFVISGTFLIQVGVVPLQAIKAGISKEEETGLLSLPEELNVQVMLHLIEGAKSPQEINDIRVLARTSKNFKRIMEDRAIQKAFIAQEDRYPLTADQVLNNKPDGDKVVNFLKSIKHGDWIDYYSDFYSQLGFYGGLDGYATRIKDHPDNENFQDWFISKQSRMNRDYPGWKQLYLRTIGK